jgi:hypothetical protein
MTGLVMLWGCDSGEKALDEVTGNRAVKQYHKSKKDLEKVTDQQSERLINRLEIILTVRSPSPCPLPHDWGRGLG